MLTKLGSEATPEQKRKLQRKVREKRKEYLKSDKKLGQKTASLDQLTNLALRLFRSPKCLGCGCKILFEYSPYCQHQFSFDRINNKKGHTIDNLRIVCWNCNSVGQGASKTDCTNGCHTGTIAPAGECGCVDAEECEQRLAHAIGGGRAPGRHKWIRDDDLVPGEEYALDPAERGVDNEIAEDPTSEGFAIARSPDEEFEALMAEIL